MKNNFSKFIAVLLVISIVIPFNYVSASYSTSGAQTYLAAHGDSPWSVMGLVALDSMPSSSSAPSLTTVSGGSAVSYEAPILAITAMGKDPRTFGSSDYVAGLKSYHINGQIGDVAMLNDDYFGILALISAGVSVSDSAIADSKDFIISRQNTDGGWGFATVSDSDTNMTSAAILALLSAGTPNSDSRIQSALTYLKSAQNNDGGFPYTPGTDSDSSSTAWAVWVFNALRIDAVTLSKSSNTPISYLEANQASQGYFKYQPGSSEDGFSATTTAYATIALQGKTLPLNIFSATSSQKFSFRIEGSGSQICNGDIAAQTALDVVKNAKDICGYTYNIQNTAYGPYLDKINNDTASGMIGWMYMVNNIMPDVGAGDYVLKKDDSVLWYYGDYTWPSTKLEVSSAQISSGASTTAIVKYYSNNAWAPLSGATVFFGNGTSLTDINGYALITPGDGLYRVYASKQGYVRSNLATLQAGQPANASVSLSATVSKTKITPESSISFIVTPSSVNFGTLAPGSIAASPTITMSNGGTDAIAITTSVSGDALFTDNLNVNNVYWHNFQATVAKADKKDIVLQLAVPQNYQADGNTKTAQLIFWATAQ
ncbi:MAG: DUF4430 domain-containing protein [Candidatus Spechtbacteria bacterium]|nr:DUF4430 domain-containing protein [Candidatus Spechtbacteria bacterium]